MATARDADELRRMMHDAWARNAERAKNVIDIADLARFMQNGKKCMIAYYADPRWWLPLLAHADYPQAKRPTWCYRLTLDMTDLFFDYQ